MHDNINIAFTNRTNINVLCVKSTNGTKDSAKAFSQLESKLPTLRGRRFYGVLYGNPVTGIYKACVESIPSDTPGGMGLITDIIPGGIYVKTKIVNWEKNLNIIGDTFRNLAEKYSVEECRPYIEYYRSQQELILYLPIIR